MTNQPFGVFTTISAPSPNEWAGERDGDGDEGRRNKKTRILSALLSAGALGVFLEGCGGNDPAGGGGDNPAGGGGGNPAGGSNTLGSQNNPFLATADTANTFTGSPGTDWVSYAGSNEGVTIDLSTATASGGWADGDTLTGINNLIGSDGDDTFTGNGNANTFRGGDGVDIYVFGADGGTNTDILTDDSGNIVFLQGSNNDYAGATYSFVRADGGRGDAVTLTVTKNSNTLNVIEFTNDPSSGYSFSTRSGIVDTAIADTELVVPAKIVGEGSESSPFLATAGVDILTGSGARDWVSYAGSNAGVTIDLSTATVSGGWAAGDSLTAINNLIGSDGVDTFTGNGNANTFRGGAGADTYVFGADGGTNTDTLTDDGGNIVFLQGSNNDYAGATYSFVRADGGRGDAVTLTVTKNSNTLNVIEFTNDPSSGYSFSTRSGVVDTAIADTELVVPAKITGEGSESSPFLATTSADAFTGSPGADWVSYTGSTFFVLLDLNGIATNGAAIGDTFTGINNIIGVQDKINWLDGNGEDNTLRGGDQNDRLQGRGGADTLEGGGGTDTVLYGDSAKGVRVDLSLPQGQAQADFETNTYGFTANNNDAVGDILTSIEQVIGSGSGDWLTGNDEANSLNGGDGNDRLEGRGGEDTYSFSQLYGTDTVVDDGGVIYFSDDEYGRANYYSYSVNAEHVLTIRDQNNLVINTIEFTIDPSAYTFSYRNDQGVPTGIDYNTFTTPDS